MTTWLGAFRGGIRTLAAVVVAAAMSLPLYLVVVNVFKPLDAIKASPLALPPPFTLSNLDAVLMRPDNLYWRSLGNSVIIVSCSMAGAFVFSALCAYYLARSESKRTRALLLALLFGLMVPFQVILVPITEVLRAIGLQNTYVGLILFNIGYYVPFGTFVLMRFIRTIPRDLDEAAAIDGAGALGTFWLIIFPLMRPASASVLIFLGVWIWNDFLNPLIILGPKSGTTVTTGIYLALGQFNTDFGVMFAFMFLASIPIVVLYVLLQRYFVSGLTGGAAKG